jgi:hypothetical protein
MSAIVFNPQPLVNSMTNPHKRPFFAHAWSRRYAAGRSHGYWQRLSDGVFENPYVRVDYSGAQVKVTVKNSYVRYTYEDPYVQVESDS